MKTATAGKAERPFCAVDSRTARPAARPNPLWPPPQRQAIAHTRGASGTLNDLHGGGHRWLTMRTVVEHMFDLRKAAYITARACHVHLRAPTPAVCPGIWVLSCRPHTAMIGSFAMSSRLRGVFMAAQSSGDGPGPTAPDSENQSDTPPERHKSGLRKKLSSPWISGILTGLITGALVTFAITPTGHSAEFRVLQMANSAKSPSCTDPGWLLQVPDDQILANSWYQATDNVPDYKTLHTPDLTVDGNHEAHGCSGGQPAESTMALAVVITLPGRSHIPTIYALSAY